MNKPEMKIVDLTYIQIGKTNPRKTFDEESIQELSVSIKNEGVIQPILLRPAPPIKGPGGKSVDMYELVCGERRYRASKLAGLTTIPAYIRELTDDQALECQITENLMRKDVHPMEEAVSFRSLMDQKKWTVEEMALRIGKKAPYVAQRLKLNDLIGDFQKAFFKDRMILTIAMTLSKLSAESQQNLWDEHYADNSGEISPNQHTLKSFIGDLSDPPFDTKDPGLNKTVGSCHACPHNTSSNTLLFPEEGAKARCLNISCFSGKAKTSFTQELEKAKNDPTVILVSDNYQFGDLAQKLKGKGHEVKILHLLHAVRKPEAPNWEDDYAEDIGGDYGQFKTEKEARKHFDKAVIEYNKEVKDYQHKVDSGKFLKAYVVEGNKAGKYIMVGKPEEKKDKGGVATSAAAVKEKMKEGKVTVEDIQGEIGRIREREKKARTADNEKYQPAFFEMLEENKVGFLTTKKHSLTELKATIVLFANLIQFEEDVLFDKMGFKGFVDTEASLWKFLENKPEAKLQEWIQLGLRILILEEFEKMKDPDEEDGAIAIKALAFDYNKKAAKALDDEAIGIRTDREFKVSGRIKQLEGEIAKLKPKATATPTKTKSKK